MWPCASSAFFLWLVTLKVLFGLLHLGSDHGLLSNTCPQLSATLPSRCFQTHAAGKRKEKKGSPGPGLHRTRTEDNNICLEWKKTKERCGLWRQSDILRTNLAPSLITIRVFMVFSRADDKLPKKKRIIWHEWQEQFWQARTKTANFY